MAYTTQQLVDLYTNANLGKGPDSALTLTLDAYATQTQVGGLSDDAAVTSTLKWVNGTTAVAVETYQFFTGKAPSAAGLAYLVNSTANTTDLNDAYYAKFSAENRFINFAINLGVFGDGAAAFAASYGNTATSTVTYAQVVASAYDKIIGNATATAAGVDVAASVAFFSRQANIDYLTAFVKTNGITSAAQIDLAVKAALIGEILNAATVSGLGAYATATTALIKDLSDGALTNPASASIFVSYPAGPTVGEVKNLTTSIDTINGTSAADTYTGVFSGGGADQTLNPLDIIGGGAGQDTLNINATQNLNTGDLSSITITGIETINVRGAGYVGIDTRALSDVTALNVKQAGNSVTAYAATTTAVSVANIQGNIYVDGGSTVNVTDSYNGGSINVQGSKGAVTVTDAVQGSGSIRVYNGTDVSVTAAKVSGNGGYTAIEIGNNSSNAPTGNVIVNSTGIDYNSGNGQSLGSIRVTGGSTVVVNQVAFATAGDAATGTFNVGYGTTQSQVLINGSSKTTSVTVNQSAPVEAVNAVTAAGTQEVQTVAFADVVAGTTVSVNGLSFKAAVNLTAAQVASAFANLPRGATVGSATAAVGSYSGTFNTLSGTTGAATADGKVTYTGTASYTVANQATLTVANASVTTVTDGVNTVDAVTGVAGVNGNSVSINGLITGADVLTTVSLNGYGNTGIGSDALASLKLAHSFGIATVFSANTGALALGLDTVGGVLIDGVTKDTGVVDLSNTTYTTLNIANTGANLVDLSANTVKALAVSGAGSLNLITGSTTASSLTALETITVTGTAGLTFNATGAGSTGLKSIDTTGTTGSVTATISAAATSYVGGAGKDSVTLSSTTVTKDIVLGAGDDTLTLATGTTSVTGNLAGGDGTDTLRMAAADAAVLSANAAFAGHISGFEKISLGAVTGGTSAAVNLANLGNAAYVISSNASAVGAAGALAVATTNGSAGTTEASDFTFGALGAGQGYTIAGRTVTVNAAVSATAAEIAQAFATGVNGANTTVTGALSGWTAANGATGHTVFTSATATTNVADLAATANGGAGALTASTTQGASPVTESSDVTFGGLTAGQSYTVAGRTVTASGAATATDVATAFSSGTSTGNLAVSGTLTGYTAAAGAVGHTVFTSTTTNTNVTDITTSSAGVNGSLAISNLANNGTLELTGAGAGVTVAMTDATGTADTLNLALKVSTTDLNFGTVTVAGVEAITIAATDSVTSTINTATVSLADTALKTVVVTGNANVALTSDSLALTSIDGSAMTGRLTAASSVTGGATLTGGAGVDILTGNGALDKLVGGAGNDVLVVHGNLQTLTGGTGADTFDVSFATTNSNSYATITDLAAGDFIKFKDVALVNETFNAAKLTLGDTAVFQDFANLAIGNTDAGDITWFQYAGNTYVVEHLSSNAATDFLNGTDVIVKITGLVDLSTASLNTGTAAGNVILGIH